MPAHHEPDRRIGNLNGPWSVLLRLALATYPLVLAWAVWITQNEFADIAFRTSGDRFTKADSLVLRAELMEHINDFPTKEWRDRIDRIEVGQNSILQSITRIETHLRINPGAR